MAPLSWMRRSRGIRSGWDTDLFAEAAGVSHGAVLGIMVLALVVFC